MDAKEEIKNRLAIEDVVGEYVRLKRAGRLWRGLSPFTNEKTPSFFVTPDKNIWHDFSSNKGGDVFSFVMEIEGIGFREALELLARKANVELEKYGSSPRISTSQKNRLLDANILAKKYFQASLVKSQPAQEYIFKTRRLTKDTVAEWGIGYAPESGGAAKFLQSKGFDTKELRSAGLISQRGGDMFYGRMMIPLCDSQGQIVGFTGRIIAKGEPKYINTPATLLYHKGRQIFGLYLAKDAIRANNLAVLVEGNLDVISSHQAGVKNVVACAGTALTLDHLKSLARLTNKVALGFDNDRAGIAATERAVILAQDLNINLYVIELPHDIKDPDELIQKDVEQWRKVLKDPKSAVEWIIDNYAATVDLNSANGKKELTTAAGRVISKLKDPVEAEHYISALARLTDTSLASLRNKIAGLSGNETKQILKTPKTEKQKSIQRHNAQVLINRILAIGLKYKNLRSVLANLPDEYLTKPLAEIKYHLLDENSIEITQDISDKLNELEIIAERIEGDKRLTLMNYLRELEILETEKRRRRLMDDFANVDNEDDKKIEILSGAIKGLNITIKLLKKTGSNDDFEGLHQVWNKRKDEV
ncbi:MAG: DNA primase [Candidatus Nomurabacteria bacterium]|jgi:DNA primase|nr:DNA primase [Candidatus Nomurabacteria bacterium]